MKKAEFVFEKMMWHLSGLGTTVFMIILGVAAFLLGKATLSIQIAAGIILVYAVVFPIKWFFYKERPAKKKYSNWLERLDAASFPSAHSNRAALLFVILSSFFNNIYFAIFLFAMSISVSCTRVYLERHYWIDVIFGYVLGIAEGIIIVSLV